MQSFNGIQCINLNKWLMSAAKAIVIKQKITATLTVRMVTEVPVTVILIVTLDASDIEDCTNWPLQWLFWNSNWWILWTETKKQTTMCAYFTSADDIRLLCTKQHAVLDAVADLSIKIYWPLLMGVNSQCYHQLYQNGFALFSTILCSYSDKL